MKINIQFLSSVFIVFLFFACGPSQRELAVYKINAAKMLIEQGDTLLAIDHLDSIKIKYPKASMQIGVAKNITDELYRQLSDNRKQLLLETDSIIASLETKFDKEKTEFDKYVQYIPKRQSFNRSWDRSFLQVNLDERGVLYLTSNYMGKEWLKHTGIRVYDGKLQAKTETIPQDDPLNHQSDFLDYKWEKVSYMNGKSDSVINFIASNPQLDLKCVFLGTRFYYILLEDYDIQAVIDALALSKAIKRKAELEKRIKQFDNKTK